MLYKLMPFYYGSLSWLHLCCNGSWLLSSMCWFLCQVGILKINSGTVSFMDDLYWSSWDMIGANYSSIAASGMGSLYCDWGATPWRLSSVLFMFAENDTSVGHEYSTITGTGIVHPSLTHFKLLCSFIGYLIHVVHCLL